MLLYQLHLGVGGIGIIRLSGDNCFDILNKIFKPKKIESIENIKGYSIKYGFIINDNIVLDEVLVSYFKSPKSYTMENMCEINSHGGNIVLKSILELCMKHGARLAEPGEFTKRAFINGRIDLLQAESVIDLINAKSEREARVNVKNLEGQLSKELSKIKKKVLDILVKINVTIDYPEYDLEEVAETELSVALRDIEFDLNKLEKSFDNGKLLKNGIKTAIVGKPNVGKSSLLNLILKEERAIVTEYEGTTRDTIEEFANINGISLKLIDTAGIRKAKDEVEKIGILKSKEIANDADLIIAVFDGSRGLTNEDFEILDIARNKKSIIVINKTDLPSVINEDSNFFSGFKDNIIKLSVIENKGIDELYNKISNLFNLNEINIDNEVLITNLRQKDLISNAIKNVQEAKKTIDNKMPIDIISIYIKNILEYLNTITGENATEDIIDEIFSKFCLGK